MLEWAARRGWEPHEIEHLKQHYKPSSESRMLTIGALLMMALAALIVPYTYGRIGMFLTEALFHVTLMLITIPVGGLFGILLSDLNRLDKRHHTVLLFAVPTLAFISGMVLFNHSNSLAVSGQYLHNAFIAAFIYAASFTIPYAFVIYHQWNSRIGRSSM